MKCYCGKELEYLKYGRCDECLKRVSDSAQALFKVCCKEHRSGGGGARICICGAGSGGSAACNGLYFLQQAIEGSPKMREEIASIFGWNSVS